MKEKDLSEDVMKELEKDRQVLSIDGQLSELKEFALREKLQVSQV